MTRGRDDAAKKASATINRTHVSCRSRARDVRRYDARQCLSMLPNTSSLVPPSLVPPSLMPPSVMPGLRSSPMMEATRLVWAGGWPGATSFAATSSREPGRQLGRRQIGGDQHERVMMRHLIRRRARSGIGSVALGALAANIFIAWLAHFAFAKPVTVGAIL